MSSLRSYHSLYEPLLLVLLCLVVAAPLTEAIRREKRKQVIKNRCIMLKYFYNNAIGFLDVDPEFIDLGLKYARKKAIDSFRIRTLNQNSGHRYKIDFKLIACQDFIRNFTLNDDFKIVNLKEGRVLSDMQSLISLSLLHPIEIEWEKLVNLERLVLDSDKYIRGLSALKTLRKLLMMSMGQEGFQEITALENLDNLDIGGRRLEHLNGIQSMQSLSSLTIGYASKLYDISPIASLPNLKTLHVECCKNMTDFSPLKGNNVIEKLTLDQVESLDFVPQMQSLYAIKFFNCIDGDLRPLLESRTLKDIFFYPSKKHYTHTLEQLITQRREQLR